ncbi:MAG: protein phosphatase 2C domain-containing protein [Acidobacteriota bacterium]
MIADAGTEAPRYLAGGLSEKGRREANEDAAILAVLPPSCALRAFAVLSDGMGGHNAGEVASRLTVEILRKKVQAFAARPDVSSLAPAAIEIEIRAWIDEVNREIFQQGKASVERKGMGATLAFALVLANDRLVVANVGDSKIFLASGLKVRQLSVDHTALAEHRRALGSDSVAPEDDASSPFAHALTRSLGQEKRVVPDVRSDVTLGPGDVVILTTDGVTDVLEAERFLTALETAGSIQEAAEEIYRLAFEAGTKDNVSVALVSRGTPARLGLGKTTAQTAAPPSPPPADGGGVLVAGAASAPAGGIEPRSRTGRRLAIGAAGLVVVAALVAIGVFLRRPAPPPVGPAAAPRAPAASTAPPGPAPAATPLPAALSPSPRGTEIPERAAQPAPAPRRSPPPARAPAEPAFRAPAALSGLQPLEYPPTPTDTPTPTPTHTATATATETATPVISPSAPPGKAPAAAAPPPAPRPAPPPGAGA